MDRSLNPVVDLIQQTGQIFILLGQILKETFMLARNPQRLKRFYLEPIFDQMVRVGVNSIPVVLTTALFTGMVLAVQTGVTLEAKIQGTSVFIGNIVSMSLIRELGPVLTAVLVTGRVGSAMAAEIGSMKITEQLDALRTLAANPIEYIAVPRFVAVTFMLPILAILADVLGLIGGWLVASYILGISSTVYWDGAHNTLALSDIFSGLTKSFFFGIILVTFALYRGFNTTGGAEGVGKSTTGAVVNASITILIADYFLTQMFAMF
jgi:phospholipid/cholesterol/gamma-HCH transport system permease protein